MPAPILPWLVGGVIAAISCTRRRQVASSRVMVAHLSAFGRGSGAFVLVFLSRPKTWRMRPVATGARLRFLFVTVILSLLLAPILALLAPDFAAADPLAGTVTVDVSGGYARLLFTLNDDVNDSVHAADNVLIITFDKPVAVNVDRLPSQASDYIGAARRDPNGRAVRLALARKVTVNSIAAGQKLFVDLLPDTWKGAPPGLPQDVVEDLARRAREADRLEKLARQAEQQKRVVPATVHVAEQPTFTRYVFDLPDSTTVTADRTKERLTLTF